MLSWASSIGNTALTVGEALPKQVSLRKRSEEVVEIFQVLHGVHRDQMWVVAWDDGDLELTVDSNEGSKTVAIAVVSAKDIKKVLSHRWYPLIQTTMGDIPATFLSAKFPEPTWVDILNHFNLEQFSERVVQEMGALYSTIPCRALYLEEPRTSLATVAEACSRSWMWQELSLGPQAHLHGSVEAVFVHLAVTIGEDAACDAAGDLRNFAQSIQQSEQDVAASDLIQRTLTSGGFEACAELVAMMAEELGNEAPRAAQMSARMLRWMAMRLLESLAAVFDARKTQDAILARAIPAGVFGCRVQLVLLGGHAASVRVCVAASEMVRARAERRQTPLTSAVANLANRNVSKDGDRLLASFAVLCARRGVPCEASAVSDMIATACNGNIAVGCLPRVEAQGVLAATQRRVVVRRGDGADTTGVMDRAVFALVAGSALDQTRCDVDVSGQSLGACRLTRLHAGLDVWSWLRNTARDDAGGVIARYELEGGRLSRLTVATDAGGVLEIALLERQIRARVFVEWFMALHVAEGSAAAAACYQ